MWTLPEIAVTRELRRLAVLTSGGDAPGMNAAVRAITRTAIARGLEVFAAERGFSGLVNGPLRPLDVAAVGGILQRGGTILKTDRCEAFLQPAVRARAVEDLRHQGIGALIVIGGDGSLTGAHQLTTETGLPVIGLPGTIDNDIVGTEDTIGFDTAVNTALEAIDRVRDTAYSHERLFLVEVMGRSSGFIAVTVGIAGGAEAIVLPDRSIDAATLVSELPGRRLRNKPSSLVVVAEGTDPTYTQRLAAELGSLGHPARACILGHIQRGGRPSGHDRVLASLLGASAVDHLLGGYTDVMLGMRKGRIATTPLQRVAHERKPLPPAWLELARTLAS
ncbi:6-phosphofructokinase [Aquisalimonas sp.]|uniref:6-phosphofructokinase n=1 Tax=Aquisalimonas sp. TaxID=1872621 RepID=UPI0025BA4C16|nr:6-phosphofructokinase [Aquisalimonas sp.]